MNTRPLRTRPIGPYNHGIEDDGAEELPDEPVDDIWHVQVAAGDVRIVTLEKLDDLFRYDVIDDQVFVWQKGMAEWIRLATLLMATEAEEPEEPFHVLVGPGNVKQLSLEQLDDFYRLEVIDEGTLIWQKGMTDWLPLGKVAGIEPAVPAELPTRPLQEIVTQPFAVRPEAAIARPSAAPRVSIPASATFTSPPVSAPPVAFSIQPQEAPEGSRSGSWLVRLSVAAGVLLALFRNDLAFSAVQNTSIGARYAALEGSLLGGPMFGTSRSVERLVADCGGHLEPVRLPIAVTQYADSQKRSAAQTLASKAEATKPSSDAASNKPAAATPSSSQVRPEATIAAAAATQTNPIGKAATPLGQNMAAALGGLPTKPAAAPTKAVSASRPAKKRGASNKSSLRSNGNYFDPLNPTL